MKILSEFSIFQPLSLAIELDKNERVKNYPPFLPYKRKTLWFYTMSFCEMISSIPNPIHTSKMHNLVDVVCHDITFMSTFIIECETHDYMIP